MQVMTNTYRRGIQFFRSAQARLMGPYHAENLLKRKPELKNIEKEQITARQELLPFYTDYIRHISTDRMAISLELASFALAFCRLVKPKRILDLGSGFSSFVFRRYAKESGCEVLSVDDNAQWLEKTRAYLEKEQLATQSLLKWPEISAAQGEFDLILHDLGNRHTRGDVLPAVYALAAKDGVIILDDFHKPDYATRARAFLASIRNRFYSLYTYTIDAFGRYSILVIKQ